MRVAARKEDDVAAARALCSFVPVDLQPQLALFDDVQGSGTGEADREAGRRGVMDDALARGIGKVFRGDSVIDSSWSSQ